MQPQPPPTPDKPDETALFTPVEFKALAVRVQSNARRITSVRRRAANIILIGVGLDSVWFLLSGSAECILFALALGFAHTLTKHLAANNAHASAKEVERLVRWIERTQDVRLLGTILEVYNIVWSPSVAGLELFTAAYHAILRLLPLIQSQHIAVLNTQQRTYLRRSLFRPDVHSGTGYWIGATYYLVTLYALEKIGDKRDLPDVERLVKEYYITDEVRAAAERCVQAIRERVAREEDKDVLLRADRKPEAVATLLRPSAENADTTPEQLLRPAPPDSPAPPA